MRIMNTDIFFTKMYEEVKIEKKSIRSLVLQLDVYAKKLIAPKYIE
jgi:hypothetical protein